ncbi:MAG: cytidylate kinase family protein [Candidatus Diapherotrites archaeon]|nr:cytidylate kinase family protein [Candidatus Diapherotrites archaeon]
MRVKHVVVISGFIGSGKSTLAKGLAKAFHLKRVSGSELLKKPMEKKLRTHNKTPVRKGFWETPEGKAFMNARVRNKKFDYELDAYILEYINKHDNVVIESRTMPWLYPFGFNIWLKVSLRESCKRVAERDSIFLKEATRAVRERRAKEVKLYRDLYGIRMGKDLKPFNLVLNTEKLKPHETLARAKKAIQKHWQKKKE